MPPGRGGSGDDHRFRDIATLIARAAPPPDRADRGVFEPVSTPEASWALRRRQLNAAFEEPESLDRHAEALGLTRAEWLSRFGDVRLVGPEPDWAVAFRAVRERLVGGSRSLEGALRWAVREVLRDWPRNLPRSDDVLDAALRHLARRIRAALHPTRRLERTLGLRPGWGERFDRSPVLGYVVGRLVADWRTDMARIALRASADRTVLSAAFCLQADPGALTRIDPGKGDPHAASQSVAILHFEQCVVLYKPKDLRVASAVGKVVDLLGGEGLAPPKLLFRGEYAWEEFHEPAPIRGACDADTFYGALGSWLALLQVYGGLDFWFDNLIAQGKTARFIDFETAAQPRRRREGVPPPDGRTRALELVVESLSLAGILPLLYPVGDGRDPVDLGCLARPGPHVLPLPGRGSSQRQEWIEDRFAPHDAAGIPADAADHFDAFERGYLRAARVLSTRPGRERAVEALLAVDDAPLRIILLDTWTCYRTMQHSLVPRALADAAWREIALHSRVGLLTDAGGVAREAMVRDLRRLDVPLFHSPVDARDLIGMGGERVPDFFAQSALAAVPDRIAALSETGEEELRACLRTIFGTRPDTRRRRSGGGEEGLGPASEADLLAWASEIASEVASRARVGPLGGPTWMGERHDVFHGLRRLDWLDFDMLSGHAGLATSLLELSARLNRADLADLAVEALAGAAGDYMSRIRWRLPAGAGYVTGAAGLIAALCLFPALGDLARGVYERAFRHEIWMHSGGDQVSGLAGWRVAASAMGEPAPADHGRGRPYAPSSLPRLAPWLDPEGAVAPCSDRRSASGMRRNRDRTGTWFADTWVDDRHNLSGVDGLPALAVCFARLAQDRTLVHPAVPAPAET